MTNDDRSSFGRPNSINSIYKLDNTKISMNRNTLAFRTGKVILPSEMFKKLDNGQRAEVLD